MNLELEGRRAIVTGGSRGIGLAVARALAAEGARVAQVARTPVEPVAGGMFVPADTGDDASVAVMVTRVVDEWGGADILVNAAATPNTGGFAEETLEAHINVKVRGYLRCARAVAPLMTSSGWGRIVNVGGLAARHSGSVVGSVRNVAVAAMTKNLADELGASGINMTVVHPGLTLTEREPPPNVPFPSIGRHVTAAEVANVIAFLCSPLSVAINGDAIAVGGGALGAIYY